MCASHIIFAHFRQNAIARHVILRQVKAMGLVSADYVRHFAVFLHLVTKLQNLDSASVEAIQQIWTENGNLISRQYAGTDAMKVAII